MAKQARAFYVTLETSWGDTVDVCLARDDEARWLGLSLEEAGWDVWNAWHNMSHPLGIEAGPWRPRYDTGIDWSFDRTLVDWRIA